MHVKYLDQVTLELKLGSMIRIYLMDKGKDISSREPGLNIGKGTHGRMA